MQARFRTLLLSSLLLAATAAPAAALVPEMPVCGYCGADAAAGDGGIWKTGAAAAPSESPSQVQTAPAEASADYLLRLEGLDGETTEGGPNGAPPASPEVQAQPQQAGMLLPAIQRVRESAATAADPHHDGVVVLDTALPGAAAGRGTGRLTLSNGNGTAVVPEQPVCGYCGADAQAQAQQQAAPEERPQRRRAPNFSFSIGGVSIGSGGVSVAAGDVDGDGRGESRRRPERRSDGRR